MEKARVGSSQKKKKKKKQASCEERATRVGAGLALMGFDLARFGLALGLVAWLLLRHNGAGI